MYDWFKEVSKMPMIVSGRQPVQLFVSRLTDVKQAGTDICFCSPFS